ncbi:MAG: helix-hairpin-helix domain-containing protein [Saprospiraceae bacterium]|nr:helix-hairpin-helix domain-containing protein [Saprospiraceae bacterium]
MLRNLCHRLFPLIVLIFGLPFCVFAQNDDPAMVEMLENFFRDNDGATESDALQYVELMENYRQKPLNLNTASRDELLTLHLLNDLQIASLLEYRTTYGPFLSAQELQAVPQLELSDIRRLLNFTEVRTGLNQRNTRLVEGLWKGTNTVLLRWGRAVNPNYDTDRAEGLPNTVGIRYQHTFDNRLSFGFTADSDPGEALFKASNPQGFDFYSAHFFARNVNRTIQALALGDFSARMGQGLLLQSGFAPGKSAETVSVARGGRKINGYSAFGEVYFLRGAAATLNFGKHLEITALSSSRRYDANVDTTLNAADDPEIAYTALLTSGLHRTPSEIEDEGKISTQMGGISVSYQGRSGHIAANGLHLQYERPANPAEAPYRLYAFRGDQLTGVSLDYQWRKRNFMFFGETARSDNGGMAAVNGLLFSADRHVTFTTVHRHLGRDYQAPFGNPFSETTGVANEQGLYMGADIRWTRRWQMNFYADVWRHPWLRFDASAPTVGREFLGRIQWQKGKNFTVYAQAQYEAKQKNSGGEGVPFLESHQRARLRLHASYKVGGGIEMRSRAEWTTYKIAEYPTNKGFVAYQEAVVKAPGSRVSGSARYGIFDTDTYDSRVYAFENDLFAAISIPAFTGRGTRFYVNLQWLVNSWLRLEGRYEETRRHKAVTPGTEPGNLAVWKMQARIRF